MHPVNMISLENISLILIFRRCGLQYLQQNNHLLYICSARTPMAVSCEAEVKLVINYL